MALAQDMLAGAQLVNMGWQRQERMQELRAQQAMNQIRERELAAQAEMLTAHSELYRQQAKMAQDAKEQETADLLAAQDYYHQLTETTDTTPEQARAQVDSVLTYKNPALGLKIQKIRTEEARQKKYAADSAAKERSSSGGGDFQPSIEVVTNPVTGEPIPVLKTSKGGATLLDSKTKPGELGPVEKEQVDILKEQIKSLIKRKDGLDETADDYRSKRFRLQAEIGTVQSKIDSITGRASKAKPQGAAPAPSAKKIKVRKDGQLFWLPESQLEEAKRQGFEPAE